MSYTSYDPVDVPITPSDAAYTSGDTVGGLLTIPMPSSNGFIYGLIVSVGEASIALAGTIYFYNEAPAVYADNAAFAPIHTDNEKLIGWQLLPDAVELNTRNVYKVDASTAGFTPIFFNNSTIYAYYVTTSAANFTGAAQDVNLRLMVASEK